jgi:hypothetical protein
MLPPPPPTMKAERPPRPPKAERPPVSPEWWGRMHGQHAGRLEKRDSNHAARPSDEDERTHAEQR